MLNRSNTEEDQPGAPLWLVTFSDLMTLLLTFFILLLSFSTLDNRKLKIAIGSLRGALGVMEDNAASISVEPSAIDIPIPEVNYPQFSRRVLTREEIENIEKIVDEAKISSDIEVGVTEHGVVLTLLDNVVFEPGTATLSPQAYPILRDCAQIIGSVESLVRIEGHTDDTPVLGEFLSRFPSNWELSIARAASVLRYFLNEEWMDPSQFSISGYGKYRPREPNDTPEGRLKNRRVEIVIQPVKRPPPALRSPLLPGQQLLPSDDLPAFVH